MGIFFISLAAIFLFVVGLLLFPLQFGVHYLKTATKEKFYIYVSLFGILIRIPIHTKRDEKKAEKRKKKKEKTQKKPIPKEKSEWSWETFSEKTTCFCEICRESKHQLLSMLSYVRRHLSCKETDFRIAFGTGNAASTGIANGAVWTAGTTLLKAIDSLIGIKKIHMDVTPDFQNKRFEIFVKTILVMRPIHFFVIYKRVQSTPSYIKEQIEKLK